LRLGPEENPLVAMPSALLRRDSMAVLDLAASPGHSLQSRRKLRQKRRWLQGLGHVAYRRATCAGGVDHVLDAFSRQKAHRFAELGIPDPFACREALRFLQTAALAGLDHGTPALELHWLDLDGRPIAIFGGAANGERLSGMILSFSSDRAVARCSPGRLLLDDVASDAARRGYRTLDLGPEEMRYKREICGRTEPLAHVVLPVTAVGRAAAQALVLARRSKRAIKRHPRLFRTINALRRLR
jgi:CelD/BcsL family acetyltransferase involved in cellulose biosynthesis